MTVVSFAAAMFACASPPQAAKDARTLDPPWEHENDIEYAKGLTDALSGLAPLISARAITNAFQWGYAVGLTEATAYERYINAEIGKLACLRSVTALIKYVSTTPTTEEVENLCAHREPEATFQGSLYAKEKLKLTKINSGRRYGDPIETKAMLAVFSSGYFHGFKHNWSLKDHLRNTEETALAHCSWVVKNAVEPPLSNEQADAAFGDCKEIARKTRANVGPTLLNFSNFSKQ